MSFGITLSHLLDNPVVDIINYWNMIGSLLYLIARFPNIMFFVCNCARYEANPREPHLTAMKNIFSYLHGIPTLRLWYPTNTFISIQSYSDVDFGGCQQEWKSTTVNECVVAVACTSQSDMDSKLTSWLCYQYEEDYVVLWFLKCNLNLS